jgi:hypothetical protein
MNSLLEQNNYLFIPNLISNYESKKLARDFKKYCDETQSCGDAQVPNSHAEYNFIGFLELLCEKTPEVSKFLEEKVLPTYVYGRVYRNGNILDKHTDRDACEISLTLHLDGDKDWPIYIKKPNGEEVELILRAGDAMMYLGCEAEHWRNKFEGEEYVQVFLHYVRSRGSRSWATFDKKRGELNRNSGEVQTNTTKENFNLSVMNENVVIVDEDFKPSVLEDFIMTFDNIISDELCDDILTEYMNQEWNATHIAGNMVDRTIRNTDTILLSLQDIINKNPEVRQKLDERMFECAANAIKKYVEMNPTSQIQNDSGYELLRYQEGQFYKEHTDSFKDIPRSVSCSFALNDDYEGGEWGFFDNKVKIKTKKGSVVMFPSNFLYPHQINTVTKGTRYSIITWFI